MAIFYVYFVTAIVCAIGISTFHSKGNPDFKSMGANLAVLILFTVFVLPGWLIFIASLFATDYNEIKRQGELENMRANRKVSSPSVPQSVMNYTISDAKAAANEAILWRACADDNFRKSSVRIGESLTLFPWENVASMFVEKISEIGAFPKEEIQQLELRLDVWLDFVRKFVLPNKNAFSSDELEQVGEFIAVASASGLEIAIASDPVRAALIYDLLPKEILQTAGLGRNTFDDLYFKAAKHARPSRLGLRSIEQ